MEYITLARVLRPQGRRGEVMAERLTDFPERFAERRRLSLLMTDGSRREAELESFWQHKGGIVLKFRGADSIAGAEALKGCAVQIAATERTPLESGAAYLSDLIGCKVSDSGAEVGEIVDVLWGAGDAPLLCVKESGGKEYMVPFAGAYVVRMDLAHKRLEMALPEGLLELDAPAHDDEKP